MNRALFIIGFTLSSLPFAVANIYSYIVVEPPCCHFYGLFGFPFALGEFGGYVGQTHFILSGLIADIVIWLASSVVIGWVFAKSLPRVPALAGGVAAWHTRTRL